MYFGMLNCLPTGWITELERVKKSLYRVWRLFSALTDQESCSLKELKVCTMSVTKQLSFWRLFTSMSPGHLIDFLVNQKTKLQTCEWGFSPMVRVCWCDYRPNENLKIKVETPKVAFLCKFCGWLIQLTFLTAIINYFISLISDATMKNT